MSHFMVIGIFLSINDINIQGGERIALPCGKDTKYLANSITI